MMTDLNDAEILARWPDLPPKPLESYTDHELQKLAGFGPAVIGGALFLKARAVRTASPGGRYGPAVLSKSGEPVARVGESAAVEPAPPKKAKK